MPHVLRERTTADTVVLTHPLPGLSSIPRFEDEAPFPQDILEKPIDKDDNMRMLLDLNGGVCEVVTGVSIGARLVPNSSQRTVILSSILSVVFPVLEAPGYKIK